MDRQVFLCVSVYYTFLLLLLLSTFRKGKEWKWITFPVIICGYSSTKNEINFLESKKEIWNIQEKGMEKTAHGINCTRVKPRLDGWKTCPFDNNIIFDAYVRKFVFFFFFLKDIVNIRDFFFLVNKIYWSEVEAYAIYVDWWWTGWKTCMLEWVCNIDLIWIENVLEICQHFINTSFEP